VSTILNARYCRLLKAPLEEATGHIIVPVARF
jgi:hypothetical protein